MSRIDKKPTGVDFLFCCMDVKTNLELIVGSIQLQ